mgnify:CR=1 FL=1
MKKIFTFFRNDTDLPFPRGRLERVARALIKGEKLRPSQSINVVVCSDKAIRRLNRLYLGKDRVTDVMAFTIGDRDFLGEVYISLQRAAAQSRRFGLTYEEEVARLFVHGVIHLLGFDHRTSRERAVMESRESRYCILSRNVF